MYMPRVSRERSLSLSIVLVIVLGLVSILAFTSCRPDHSGVSWDYDGGSGCGAYVGLAEDAADETGLDLALIMGVMRVESNFRAEAESGAGAQGLMQVMPGTGRHFDCGELFDPGENIICGARVLAKYIKTCRGDITYGVAAYNTGLKRARAWQKKGRTPANKGYVRKVLDARRRFARHGCGGF